MNLVLIETSGNQAFIFATNKLRENVGASELIVRVGTRFVLEAVHAAGGMIPPDSRAPITYPRIGDQNPVEVILAVSGKALLLVRDAALGRHIVREVTLRTLQEAPGLEVRGVVSRDFEFETTPLHPLIGEVHRQFEAIRSRLPGPAARFQRLPIIAECASSGLPAQRVANHHDGLAEDERREYSAQTFAKLQAREPWKSRLEGILTRHNSSAKLPDATTELEKLGCDWLAIVHADGNGLGQVFLKFDHEANTTGNRDYIDKLRSFSLALDECTEKAFCRSLAVIRPRRNITPIVPLVLGGDDLTVVCDGRQALQFTKEFIDCFEEETRQHLAVNAILKNGVTSCAGVAIVKPHFPFFAGYQLAEQLLQSAKKLAKENPGQFVSAIDYHILYDASGPDLDRIRRELTVEEGQEGKTLLVGRPYVTTADRGPVNRRWSDLQCRIAAVRAQNDEHRRRLPSSMLHELREGLFLGHAAADAQLRLVLERYRKEGLDRLLGDTQGNSLFWKDGENRRTALLDAVDTAEFWEAQA
jgi:hypothetical protein